MIRFLFWLPIFFLPSFQLLRLIAIPAPNTVFLLLPMLIQYIRGKSPHRGILIFASVIAALLLHAYLTDSGTLIFYALLLTPLIFIAGLQLKFINLKTAADLVAFIAIVNAIFCCIQLLLPGFGISNINEGYDVSQHNVQTLEKILPFLPSFGRLRGIYNENGPMVLYLLLHTIFLMKLFSSSALRRFSMGSKRLYTLAICLNIVGIFFTGSKTTIISAPLLLICLLSTRKTSLSRFSANCRRLCSVRPVIAFLLTYTAVFALINGIPYLIDYSLNELLQGFIGIEMRLSTDAVRFSLFSVEGLLPTSEGDTLADSLSAYHLYTYAFGSLLSSLLISSYLYFLSRYAASIIYVIIAMIGLLVSGSFLLPFYCQLVVLSTYAMNEVENNFVYPSTDVPLNPAKHVSSLGLRESI